MTGGMTASSTSAAAFGSALVPTVEAAPSAEAPLLRASSGGFVRAGRPHRILSGSIHYFRIHPDQWEDRLRRVAALGLNTVDTYIPWNFHQRRAGETPNFSGWRNFPRFIELAGRLGLDVIVRPGPYICAEWRNGGLPVWVTSQVGPAARTSDPRYLELVGAWFDELVPRVAALQAGNGGPVVAVQAENEYGSYGDDADYTRWMVQALRERGITELLYTADGPTALMQDAGAVPGVLSGYTLGSRATDAHAMQRSRRPEEPFLVAEYWSGWFDHWGEKHHVRTPKSATHTLREIVDCGGNVSIYMAHGGTNFGLWAGANHVDGVLAPTVTSYDSDAPVAEDGRLTEKFFAFREILLNEGLRRAAPASREQVPGPPAMLEEQRVPLTWVCGLREAVARLGTARLGTARLGVAQDVASDSADVASVDSPVPLSFDALGVDAGMVAYRAQVRVPHGEHTLTFTSVRDRASIWADAEYLGEVTADNGGVPVRGRGEPITLDVLVEELGRVNYGHLLGEEKGLLGPVLLDRRQVFGWTCTPLPVEDWNIDAVLASAHDASSASDGNDDAVGLYSGLFEVPEPADTHVALPGLGRGLVWVNGFLLGRYWDVGPQRTLYCPAPVLRPGQNRVAVLEVARAGSGGGNAAESDVGIRHGSGGGARAQPWIELRPEPELGPAEEYIETF